MTEAYLTIDDSPSPRTDDLLDFLESRKLQALFFCRGAFMEIFPEQVRNIIRKGHILANHLYSHQPASQIGPERVKEEILKTEALIDQAYRDAGIEKPGFFLRFPYLDRGDGAKNEQKFHNLVKEVQSGSDAVLEETGEVHELQEFLRENSYVQPFDHVNHPLYQVSQIKDARDCLLTYTSYDWMLSPRHRGKQPYKTVDDLKQRIDEDPFLLKEGSVNVVLFHDDREGIIPETCELIDHMIHRGIKFKEYIHE